MKVYYRGTIPEETKRISTGNSVWDKNLFCATYEKAASFYGNHIEVIMAKPEAKILIQGTKEFDKIAGKSKNMQKYLDWCTETIIRAKQHGYDIVEFQRQIDVGTVILNEEMVVRNYKKYDLNNN